MITTISFSLFENCLLLDFSHVNVVQGNAEQSLSLLQITRVSRVSDSLVYTNISLPKKI